MVVDGTPTLDPDTSSSLVPGNRLDDRYRLDELLHDGGGHIIWLATDELLARPVTVHTIDPERAPAFVDGFRTVAEADDIRLVRVFDANGEADQPYVVTEWVPGRTLADLLRHGPLDIMRAVDLVATIADGLAGGLPRMRLRPESVLWSEAWDTVKLAVPALPTRDPDAAAADTQALARLLYAALTGHWHGDESDTPLPAAPRHSGNMLAPHQLRASVPRAVDAITCRALGRGGGPPIGTPAELAAELSHVRRARPASLIHHSTRSHPKRSPWAAVAAAVLSCVLLATSVTLEVLDWPASSRSPLLHAPSTPAPTVRSAPPDAELVPERVRSVGPDRGADGDHGELAALAVDDRLDTAWRTHWYTTPEFGNLKEGTGLLLDLGTKARLTDIQVALGDGKAGLRITVGTKLSPGNFVTVARKRAATGHTMIPMTAPRTTRYVLVWLTRLPPTSAGHRFQGAVHDITVHGRALGKPVEGG